MLQNMFKSLKNKFTVLRSYFLNTKMSMSLSMSMSMSLARSMLMLCPYQGP
jgi:hypothetical protein